MNKGSLCCQFSLCWTFAKRLNVEYPRSFSSGRGLWLRFDRRLKSTELLLNLHSMERKANLPYFQISIFAANLWNNFPKLLPTFSQNWEWLQNCNIETSDQNWGERSQYSRKMKMWKIFAFSDVMMQFEILWACRLAPITCHFSHFVSAIPLYWPHIRYYNPTLPLIKRELKMSSTTYFFHFCREY